MPPDQMPGFDQLPLFFRFYIEHPSLVMTLGLLWGLWVAFALGMIWFELHAHNSREEKNEFRRQFQNERQDRFAPTAMPTSRRGQPPSTTPDLSLKPPDE